MYRIQRFLKFIVPKTKQRAVPLAGKATLNTPDVGRWYSPVLLGPSTIGEVAVHSDCLRNVMQIIERLEPDEYIRYLQVYYQTGLERFGHDWRYADIVTVLLAAAQLIHPQQYLEIGVRRGRSMAMVAATCPECDIVGFDLWQANYAGIPNPGPTFVTNEMKKLGHRGQFELVSGNSHESLQQYFTSHPDAYFDLATVDGDHSERGAMQDLVTVASRLKVGGILVFDDICHPALPYLYKVWRRAIARHSWFTTWEFTELGYGVAIAIRR